MELGSAAIKKLSHESPEVRLRALEQIYNKLNRALKHNEQLILEAGELCTKLIRLLDFEPPLESERVLQILLLVLRSNYCGQAIERLGLESFQKDIEKVKLRVKNQITEVRLLDEILSILNRYKSNQKLNDADAVIDFLSLNDEAAVGERGDGTFENDAILARFKPTDFETAWSKATAADLAALHNIADFLNDNIEVNNALLHLDITMYDYPAELMLQSPYIFLKLIQLYQNTAINNSTLQDIARTINHFLDHLFKRLKLRRNVYAYSGVTGISKIQGNTQLKVSVVLNHVFEQSVNILAVLVHKFNKLTPQIVEILTNCMKLYRHQEIAIDTTVLTRLYNTIIELQECFMDDEYFCLPRINYLLIACLFDDILICNKKFSSIKTDNEFLHFMLWDYAFKKNFPKRHQNIEEYVCKINVSISKRYQKLKQLEKSIHAAVMLLKTPSTTKSVDAITYGMDIYVALEHLKSERLAECLFNAIIDCNAYYISHPELCNTAKKLLLYLLRLNHEPLKIHIFNMLSAAIKRHYVCLMNCDRYCIGLTHEELLGAQILGVPLSSEILLQLIYNCGEGTNETLRRISENTIVLILNSQNLLSKHWINLLELLIPVLNLLQCCTQSPRIVELLHNLFHPDTDRLPFLAALQGNLVFMFYKNSAQRSEALDRLIYMISSVPEAYKYVPNLQYINDIIPNNLCILKMACEYKEIFNEVTPACERDTLHNLLAMLEMPDIEPYIRKTTLMQLNVMCLQWHTLAVFCEENAHYLVLRALENSMLVDSHEDYTGAAIPAVGILSKVLLFDAVLRSELADTPNIYILLLRALCLYHNDSQLRQDACICLFLLLFSSYLVVLSNQRIEAPSLLSNIQLPLTCDMKPYEQCNELIFEYENIFQSKSGRILYMRHFLAESFLGESTSVSKDYLEKQKKYDFDADLYLTLRDMRLMKATNPKQNIQRFLRAISNATDHKSLINTSISLQIQLLVRDESVLETTSNAIVTDGIADELFNLIGKYLQLLPGNESDYELFEELLDLCAFCVRLPVAIFVKRLANELVTDFHHALIALLKKSDTKLRLYYKLCSLLAGIVITLKSINYNDKNLCFFYTNLFELIFHMITHHFQKRDLLRTRCLLRLQKAISASPILNTDVQLLTYCKRYLKLSLALKSFTQTGAQWHIDCLTIVCQLYAQMEKPKHNFHVSEEIVKYLSGLCGHCDQQVRALAWCILTYVARYSVCDDYHSGSLKSGIDFIVEKLSYLPGGFAACCLCTMLDVEEAIVVRQLAANLFVEFLNKREKCSDAYDLITRHKFLAFADEAARSNILFENQLTSYVNLNTLNHPISCDLISYLCRICLSMIQIHVDFLNELCESEFMMRLYEILKAPPLYNHQAYDIMCGDVCHLYGSCYPLKFHFLQRTLCRDRAWLNRFYQLIDQSLTSDSVLVNKLQLLMVLCKDDLAYDNLCNNFSKTPEPLMKQLLRALSIDNLNMPLQWTSLAVLNLLLIKGQKSDRPKTFGTVLEENFQITIPTNEKDATSAIEDAYKGENMKQCDKIIKSNAISNVKILEEESKTTAKSASTLLFVELFRLFQNIYSKTVCIFEVAPTKTQMQIIEVLSVLLALSPAARMAAKNFKLFDEIAQIFNTFFEQFKCTASTYVRRYGENKKVSILKHFQLLLNVYLNWFSAQDAALIDDSQSITLSKIIIQLWPWLIHSVELKELVLQVCRYHSEYSFVGCKQFSKVFSGYTNSLLELIINVAVADTTKLKVTKSENFSVINKALRVIINCCSCAEGRVTIIKANTLDMFDSLYPFNLKSPKIKSEVLWSWLEFWELFSRYPEGAKIRNLNALCDVILRSPSHSVTRVFALRILRNMCFLRSNCSTLTASWNFILTFDTIITMPLEIKLKLNDLMECASFEEQLIVCVGIWKLLTIGAKYVSMLRSTKLANHSRRLRDQLSSLEKADCKKFSQLPFSTDLSYVLDVVLNIFNS